MSNFEIGHIVVEWTFEKAFRFPFCICDRAIREF